MKIEGAIFDMDGLMFDTERLAFDGWIKAAEELNYPITPEIINSIRGTNVNYSRQLFLEKLGKEIDYDKAREVRTRYVNDTIEKEGISVKEGLIELLEFLKKNNIKRAVATSTHKALAEEYLRKGGVYKYFDYYVYGDMVSKGKPDPEIFLIAAKGLGVSPERCMVFEDSPNGITAGKNAGMMVTAVPDLTELDEEILKKVTYACKNLKEAINYIDK